MDKNTLIGFALIAAIFLGFYVINQPSEQELALYKHQQDSVATAKILAVEKATMSKKIAPDSSKQSTVLNDSSVTAAMKEQYGAFAVCATGKNQTFTIENTLVKLELSSKGGKVNAVTLKKYKTSSGKPVVLFDKDSSSFGFVFNAQNRQIATDNLYYTVVGSPNTSSITLRLAVATDKYIDYQYTLTDDSYLVGYTVKVVGMQNILTGNHSQLALNWKINALKQEKTLTAERMATTIYYHTNDGVDYLSETSDDDKKVSEELKWVALKQQYFTSVLIADKAFKGSDLKTTTDKGSQKYVRQLEAHISLPYADRNEEIYAMRSAVSVFSCFNALIFQFSASCE
jgi:YidC/Oxa1 family membrane protein insertase